METLGTYNEYELIKSLFRNERNEIKMAKRNSDGQTVILKQSVLLNENISRASRLAHEYEIGKDFNHPGIPKILDILYDGKTVTLVQEYIDGSDVKSLVFRKELTFLHVLDIAVQLADVLHYLHQKGIIHKDINSGNLMLAKNGTLKLLDFGISSNLYSESNDILNVDQIEGTLTYISPEQTGRTTYSVTQSCDFYSFGILLYELLTGKPPFDSVDPLEVIHFHLSRKPMPLKSVVPNLPDGLEKVVAKLMEKNPDDRYHNALGLMADLVIIKNHYSSKKPLDNFIAGLNDINDQYRQNQKLYGRENEINELLDYYKNIHRLQSMLVLVAGYSGVGKSALIKHIKFPIIQNKGTFLSGKFDQFKKDIPYYAFIEAIREFIKNLLSEPEEKMKYWRERILNILGENAGLITEVIPQLSKIIGKQAQVTVLQPAEQETRFNMVLLDFVYAFSTFENPLVIFLDDLQWADLPSLNLVLRILQNPKQDNILILGAYRDNDVDKGHPLLITLKQINDFHGHVKEIKLQPLNLETTCKITADSFGMNENQSTELGTHIFTKTKGNPFFIHSFLKSLYDKKLLTKQPGEDWVWNSKKISELGYTDNVIDLMTEGLTSLPEPTQKILQLAAVLGNTFTIGDLADISELAQSKVFAELLPALKGGYIFSPDKRYRNFAISNLTDDFDENYKTGHKVKFTFSHDRVQQAAYKLTSENELNQLHLKIGRLLLKNRNEEQLDEDIFEVVNHFSLSYQLINDKKEKEQIAQLCLSAGQKAKDSTSYSLGVNFLNIAHSLLDNKSWVDDYNLTYNVLLTLGECEYLNNNPERAEKYFKEVLGQAKSRFEKLQVYYLHSSLYLKMGNTSESLRLGLEAARMYNIRFPKNKFAIQIFALMVLLKYLFLFSTKYKKPESIFNIKDCTDAELIALNKFLIDLATSAYQQDQNLMMLVVFKIIKLYLKDGFTDASGWGFSGFSVVVLSVLKLQKRGFYLWNLTTKLHQRTNSPLIKWRLSYTVLSFYNHWSLPFSQGYNSMLETLKACVLNGDQIFTGYTFALIIRTKLMASGPLKEILQNVDDHFELVKNTKGGLDFFQGFWQTAKSLHGLTDKNSWNDETFNGVAFQEYLINEGNKTKLAFFFTSKIYHLYFLEQYREAIEESDVLMNYSDNFPGDICEVIQAFYTSISIATIFDELKPDEKIKYLKHFKKNLSNLKLWAGGCNSNYGAFYHLLMAEYDILTNQGEKALTHYLKSIQIAAENRILNVEAIAYERAAVCCLAAGLPEQGHEYIQKSHQLFNRWGAISKCNLLAEKYHSVLSSQAHSNELSLTGTVSATSVSGKNALDLASVLKASQTIASQVKYSDLLKNLMHITIENAGAERGCLLLFKGNQLCIEALGVSGKEGIEILPSIPYEESDMVPKTLINYCRRAAESVVVNEAKTEERFNNDPYIQKNQTLSMLCVPITALGNMKGLLYLENNLLKGAFSNDRIELLQMLSGQIGISIENSLLYENLEEKVQERTREIKKTLTELKATQSQLIHSEKMASLGELTAGIAHEIQNPLNFVNNFSEVSKELLDEMKEELEKGNLELAGEISDDVIQNLDKILQNGKRADSIVKGMLQHSRTSSGQKEPTDINALCDEYLRLSFLGMRSKDKEFNADFKTELDKALPKINVIPQDIARVLLNLINNAFYAAPLPPAGGFKDPNYVHKPLVIVKTSYLPPSGGGGAWVSISVSDNGPGIPDSIKDKIFQPFFTTKPTGSGTGLGLSLSYDIVKAHGGEIKVESVEGEGTEFIILLPINQVNQLIR